MQHREEYDIYIQNYLGDSGLLYYCTKHFSSLQAAEEYAKREAMFNYENNYGDKLIRFVINEYCRLNHLSEDQLMPKDYILMDKIYETELLNRIDYVVEPTLPF